MRIKLRGWRRGSEQEYKSRNIKGGRHRDRGSIETCVTRKRGRRVRIG